MQDDTPDEWHGDVDKVQWQPALMDLNFDATADLQDAIYEAEAGELTEGELLANLRSAVNLLQERESELLRVVLHGNELATALNSMHSKKPQDAKLRHDMSLLSLANTQLKGTVQSGVEALSKLMKDTSTETQYMLPTNATLPEAVKCVADFVEAFVTKQAFQEAAHRKLLTSYELSLQESGGSLLRGAKKQKHTAPTSATSVGLQTELGSERQVEIDILNARCAELEQMLTASQERNLDDASTIEALTAEVGSLKAGRGAGVLEVEVLKGHRAELEKTLSEFQAEKAADADKVSELQAQVNKLTADSAETVRELTEQLHALKDAAKNAANNNDTQDLVREVGKLKEQRTELERMLLEAQEQGITDATMIAELRHEVGNLKARVSTPLPQSELEKKLVTAQEQNLIDASMIETLKEQVAKLEGDRDASYSTDKSDAVSEQLERSMGHAERADVAAGHLAVLQADTVGLQEKMVTMNAAIKALGDTVSKLWASEALLRVEVVRYILEKAACGGATQTHLLEKLEVMLTQWEHDAEQRAAMVVTSQGVQEPPSVGTYRDMLASWKASRSNGEGSVDDTDDVAKLREEISELKYVLNGVIDEKQELEGELLEARCQLDALRCDAQQGADHASVASSIVASTASSKWTPARAPAQPPLEAPLPPAINNFAINSMTPLGNASPLNLQMAPSPMSTAPSSPEMSLRWATPRARPALARRDPHQRLPMGAFVLPPAPEKHRFTKKPGPQTPTHIRTREDDLIDALSIPLTDSFVLDSNMSPSDTSESFSPPMSPAGRRAVLRMLAGGTSPSTALPLSPLHCHRGPVVVRVNKGVQTGDSGIRGCSSPASLASRTSEQCSPLKERDDDDLQYSGEDSDL